MVTGIIGKKVGMTQRSPRTARSSRRRCSRRALASCHRSRRWTATATRPFSSASWTRDRLKENKATQGHFKKAGVPPTRIRREVRVKPGGDPPKTGDQVNVSIFADGERVDVIGTSRGKGFQGVEAASLRRRSCDARLDVPSRTRIDWRVLVPVAGSEGHAHGRAHGRRPVTVRNLKVLRVDADNNLLMVEGAVPGGAEQRRPSSGKRRPAKPVRVAQAEPAKKRARNDRRCSNGQNEKIGSLELRDEVFGGRIKTDLIHESVVRANAADRRGTHATKTRAMVSGSGKKPGARKGPAVRASAKSATRCGGRAAPCSARSRGATSTVFREGREGRASCGAGAEAPRWPRRGRRRVERY